MEKFRCETEVSVKDSDDVLLVTNRPFDATHGRHFATFEKDYVIIYYINDFYDIYHIDRRVIVVPAEQYEAVGTDDMSDDAIIGYYRLCGRFDDKNKRYPVVRRKVSDDDKVLERNGWINSGSFNLDALDRMKCVEACEGRGMGYGICLNCENNDCCPLFRRNYDAVYVRETPKSKLLEEVENCDVSSEFKGYVSECYNCRVKMYCTHWAAAERDRNTPKHFEEKPMDSTLKRIIEKNWFNRQARKEWEFLVANAKGKRSGHYDSYT